MKKSEAKKRIIQLYDELKSHNYNYYLLNNPVITDFEYDILMQELQALEKRFPEYAASDSPTRSVGSDLSSEQSGFAQYKHKHPMLSLGNTYDIEELYSFNERIQKGSEGIYGGDGLPVKATYNCELKFDGTAICLTYRNGKLFRALTRGDGSVGDDVTLNVMQIPSIPKELKKPDENSLFESDIADFPQEFEIRGEIYMPYNAFDRLNHQRELDEDQPFANPRNAAAGSIKLLDCKQVKERGLECTLYHLIAPEIDFSTHSKALEAAASWGLPVSELSRECKSIEEVIEYINYWDIERKKLPFATDGIVIKVNQLAIQKSLGFTAKSPRWATAFKFKPEVAITKLVSISYQVGRTGAITPVANLEPVQLSGTIVKRASLHNSEQMELLDIHTGDYVYVVKGGEIIPKITGVEIGKRPLDATKAQFPEFCPDCRTKLVKDVDEARSFCPNSDGCPMQIKGKFIHFISRKAMNINAGEATIEQLYNKGYINDLSDLYKLTREQLLTLDKWKEKSADNFLKSLEESKKTDFSRVLFALGIRYIGETTAKNLAGALKSMEKLAQATKEELLEIEEIGEKLADSIVGYFSQEEHLKVIDELKTAGLQMACNEQNDAKLSEKLKGKTFVVSGTFSISREELKKFIEQHGGKIGSSVSGNTDFLVAGEKSGESKLQKASKLNIQIVSEEELYAIINNGEI
ncbi:MAG: NAD-dependent DNA ligase LigA [Bacteroidales bacterium]|nr:NAD-dependent DNA ligase LigA [Bacteroidales bacterium]